MLVLVGFDARGCCDTTSKLDGDAWPVHNSIVRSLVGTVVLVTLACGGTSCDDNAPSSDVRDDPSSTVLADLHTLRSRPLDLPTVATGQRCPVTTEVESPSADLGPMLGTGVARPVGLGPDARLGIAPPENFGSETFGGNKVLWALSAASDGIVLVRGRQLDGTSEVRFDSGDIPSLEKVLDPTGKVPLDGGWYDFPGNTRVQYPGCYAYQIDSIEGRQSLFFSPSDCGTQSVAATW